jgi:predicted dehydrogenase
MELPFKTEGHPYNPEVDHFIDCILDDKPTSCDAIDGAKSTMAVLKAIEAIGTGRAVAIPRL